MAASFRWNKVCVLFFLIMLTFDRRNIIFAQDWEEEKSAHFIIAYSNRQNSSWAHEVLSKAEGYYDKIADKLGYSRYDNFWTWDNRVKIIVYSDKDTFIKETGQPPWSLGGAVVDHRLQSGMIITYKQQDGFLESVLPHELGHLILRDFIGKDIQIPLWFDEGVAQLQESEKGDEAEHAMRSLVRNRRYIPLRDLLNLDIRSELDPLKVAIFYAESVSILNFLITKYGSSQFGELCKFLREGRTFEEALKGAYSSSVDSIEGLQEKWLDYMQNS